MGSLHPKWYGLGVAAVFFLLALWTLAVEATLIPEQPGQALFYSGLRTLFAFLGGAGFTAFLSMHIYEYITSRNQVHGWKHEFDVDKVRQTYGPLYDEMRRATKMLDEQLHMVRLRQVEVLQRQYMSILVPPTLLQKIKGLLKGAKEFGKLHDQLKRKMGDLIMNNVSGYVLDQGGGQLSFSLGGGEWQYVLGVTHPSFKANYDRMIEMVENHLRGRDPQQNVAAELARALKALILPVEEGQQLLDLRDDLKNAISEILAELEPLIREPYKA